MSLLHIRGVQPSTKGRKKRVAQIVPRLSGLHKTIQKIVSVKKKNNISSSSFGTNNIMDQKCFSFFMDHFINARTEAQIAINTQECINFLGKHNVEFINEKTQEITNAKVLITQKTNRKRNNATFVIQLPIDYSEMLLFLILIKIDFGNVQIEFSPGIERTVQAFISKAKKCGFKFYHDFIRLNVVNKRFIIIRN